MSFSYFYIALTIFFTVYAQLVTRWQMRLAGNLPNGVFPKFLFILQQCFNPWVLSIFMAGAMAAFSWMAAMTKFEISYAYPFLSLSFVFILMLSSLLLGETLNAYRIIGTLLVTLGVFVTFKG